MYSFEGEFRRKPVQSLGGASKKEHRDTLIEKRQEDRRKREDHRKRNASALAIQAFYRGAKVRKKQCNLMRKQFDIISQQPSVTTSEGQVTHLMTLTRYLLFFYTDIDDGGRLTWLSQQILKTPGDVAKVVCQGDSTGLFQLNRLLAVCCSLLQQMALAKSSLAIPMRMLEVFTNEVTYQASCDSQRANQIICHILHYLVLKGYYGCLRILVEQRIPDSLECSSRPPTPLAASILQLVEKPLTCLAASRDDTFKSAVLQSLSREMLCRPHSDQIRLFLLPALADGSALNFHLLLMALVPPALRRHLDGRSLGSASSEQPPLVCEDNEWMLPVDASPWLLWSMLSLAGRHLGGLDMSHLQLYLLILSKLVPLLHMQTQKLDLNNESDSESESEDDMMQLDQKCEAARIRILRHDCLQLLDSPAQVTAIVSSVLRCHGNPPPVVLNALCIICHSLMIHCKMTVHRKRLLYSLAFNPAFLRNLWYTCISVSKKTVTGDETPLLQLISRGSQLSSVERDRIIPLLSLFASLFSHSLLSLHDSEFYGTDTDGSQSLMPFTVAELVPMSLALRDTCLGVIELAHPDTKPAMKDDYRKALRSVGVVSNALTTLQLQQQRHDWAYLFRVTVQLVKQLYVRDSRQPFCPPSHWLTRQVNIQADKPSQLFKVQGGAFMSRAFGDLSTLNPSRVDEDGTFLSTSDVRNLTILTELPFVVSFQERFKIFHRLIHQDRLETQGEVRHLAGGPSIQLMVRRNYLYEDAFEKLSIENEPNLRLRMQVQLVNFAGLDEVGIDGGGIFREFMSELMKTAFDPNRGFFRHTTDQLLYPNPGARVLQTDFTEHYFFLGRILGKAIYENMLVELPFASFFLSKILSRHRGDVDIHHLASLDPEMYKNLLFLKSYQGDVSELGLDFTVVNNDLGEAQVVDLKAGGHDITVTNSNAIEYIHLMADYRLNKQMRAHCNAFRQGLANVINIEWLRMFDHNEVQLLISGAVVPIDLDDLRQNTNYSGGYSAEHEVIQLFWTVVFNFSDKQRRQLLKFVTSCSRPPLLGFKDLYPAFCIHHAGNEADRLPTASTCMNLLKLPEFKDEATMRRKLLYALESGAGFELS